MEHTVHMVTWEGYPPLICSSLDEAEKMSQQRYFYEPYVDYRFRFSQPAVASTSFDPWIVPCKQKKVKPEPRLVPSLSDINYDLSKIKSEMEAIDMELRWIAFQYMKVCRGIGSMEGPEFLVKGWPGRYWINAYRSIMEDPDREWMDAMIDDALYTSIVLEKKYNNDIEWMASELGPLPNRDVSPHHDKVAWVTWAYMADSLHHARKVLMPYTHHKKSNDCYNQALY